MLWVGNSWGGSLARIDTCTLETSYVKLPATSSGTTWRSTRSTAAWTNLWGADRVMRYDPATSTWTAFDIPTRGSEPRYVSLDERNGKMQGVLPYFRARKVAVMTVRSEGRMREIKRVALQ